MGYGEFMTNGGDTENIDWEKRKYKIADNIGSQLQLQLQILNIEKYKKVELLHK